MIFNNERYETVAFWDKYKHVKVYITAEKKGKFHIADRKEGGHSLPGAASRWDRGGCRHPRLACVASPSKRVTDEGEERIRRHTDPRTNKMIWRKKRKT